HPASFRFRLTADTLAFGYILPTTGRIRDLNPLETCAARRTAKAAQNFCAASINDSFFNASILPESEGYLTLTEHLRH
ncbi:hypothetical protein, partial [Bilifractor sp. HCP3S3_D3]|uniref:hypothetical protein n=1 Tax=unclassified Bilifractor TaxID=2815795 RepID=UPI003F892231